MKQNQKTFRPDTKSITLLAMLCAIAFVAKLLSRLLPDVAGFLSFDLKDVVIVISGFMLGVLPAALVAIVTSLIEMITVSSTGPIGLIMNILASCSFACIAAALYQRKRTMANAVLGLGAGTLCMTALMLLWNWLITPLYMKVPREVVAGMLLSVFLPFNLVKGGINATLAMLLYKPVATALRRAGLLESGSAGKHSTRWGVVAVSSVLFVTFLLLALVLAGVL